jgi:uncharacterized membrane protein SpoIIM required for sporulation
MKETTFIEQNKEKWQKYEKMTLSNYKNPDELSDLFIQVVDDLSYSRTFYPNRAISAYLNRLAQQILYNLHGNPQTKWGNFIHFWTKELPYIVYHSRLELLVSLILFLVSVGIGVLSSIYDPDFCRVILGDHYINMTLENIEKGDPMAVYKSMNEMDMFLGISLNNVRVAIYTFFFGIIGSIGTVGILLYNGIMVGTFQYFFIEKGLFWESFSTIWLHGTLEMSSIILAGGAGILLGKGIVFPGTYNRLKAFQIYAERGLKLFLGILPIIIFAAVIESYFTRYTDISIYYKLGVILLSLFFIIGYFVWYPHYLAKKGFGNIFLKEKLLPNQHKVLEFEGKIKTISEVFADGVYFFKSVFKSYLNIILFCGGGYIFLTFNLMIEEVNFRNYEDWLYSKLAQWFDYHNYPMLFIFNGVGLSICFLYILRKVELKIHPQTSYPILQALQVVLLLFLFNIQLSFKGWMPVVIVLFTLPFWIHVIFISYIEKKHFFWGIYKLFKVLPYNVASFMGMYLLLFVLSIMFYGLSASPFTLFYKDVLKWSLPAEWMSPVQFMFLLDLIIFTGVMTIIIPIFLVGLGFQYFSFKEINEANTLKARVLSMFTS